MNKQQLAAKIWESANRMRSKIEANEYKDYILGFIFYKYLSDKEEQWLYQRDYDADSIREYVNEEADDQYSSKSSAQQSLGYFIAYKDLFSTWIHMGSDFSVDNVRTGLSSFNRLISPSHKKVFEGIFNTLETGLSKLGENTKSQTKAVSDLIQLINEIPMSGKQDYDVLGFIYEYLISNFAANAGKKAGEFYTPHEVSLLMSEIVADHLQGRSEIKIYDPTSGSGSLLINIGKTAAKYMDDANRIRYYAQELKANTYNLTRMNLVMRGILPDNILTRNGDTLGEEGAIRKNLIEQNNIDAIIGLPANIFFGTGIPTIIMVLRQKRENTDVLIIDASKGFAKEGKNNKLRASDIRRIIDTVKQRKTVTKYSKLVPRQEIRDNDYNLNIPRYVDSSEEAESYDIYASMFGGIPKTELEGLKRYWDVFPSLQNELFEGDGEYLSLKTEDIKKVIHENLDVKTFIEGYQQAFADFDDVMDETLIDAAESLSIPKTEEHIASDIFVRFHQVPLIDPYQAYEIFEGAFATVSGDLELIQAEGMQAVKQVDPNMVIKKKDGKDHEVQEGWKGHILPFELVQQVCLSGQVNALKEKQDQLAEIPSSYEELLDGLSEDDKEIISDALNDTNDGFVFKNIKSMIKSLKVDGAAEAQIIEVLQSADRLNTREKKLKSEIKQESEALHLATKDTIEQLTDAQVRMLLHDKWIQPVEDGILALSADMLNTFIKKIEELSKKYAVTMSDLEAEIQETEKTLASMLSDLVGSEEDMAGIRELQKLLGGNLHE